MTILQYLIEKKDKKNIHLHIQGKNQSDINVNMDRLDTEIWICECVCVGFVNWFELSCIQGPNPDH